MSLKEALRPVDGVDLPRAKSSAKQRAVGLGLLLLLFFFGFYEIISAFKILARQIQSSASGTNLLKMQIDIGGAFSQAFFHPIKNFPGVQGLGLAFLLAVAVTFLFMQQINYSAKQVAYGQKGDSRFTTVSELKDQYPEIPEKDKSFKGFGGFPISHYKKSYFIDTETNHNIVVGTSRSGKGQTVVVPMIDNLSRAEKASSMIINDPKGELFAGASDTLRKRGYDVYLLNMADLSKSMAYNPLQLVVKAWTQGDTEGAMQLINSLTYTLYHDENAGQNAWVNEGAQSAVNGMIISLIEYCDNPDNFPDHQRHLERVTLNNIIDMLNELGTVQYYKDPQDLAGTNVLDEFFKHLPPNSIAKREYGSTNFSEAKAKGSIFSTIVQKLQTFSMPKNARATSANSIELKSIGFPKYVSFSVDENLANKKLKLRFFKKNEKGKYPAKADAEYTVGVSFGGFAEYNFADDLKTGDIMQLSYGDLKKSWKLRINKDKSVSFKATSNDKAQIAKLKKQIKFLKSKEQTSGIKEAIKDCQKQITELENGVSLSIYRLKMHYSDKPTAVFLKIPDYDSSNNALASIFVSQLYSELAKQCSFVSGGKTVKRVHFILDEFGNMLPIQNMDQIMTVSAGRNLLFTLIIQSYKQLYSSYGNEKGATIKENGQNQILIATTDKGTLEEFSELAGSYTVEGGSVNRDKMGIASNYNASADSLRLITVERLSQMLVGEDLVLRPLHRQNLKHEKRRPYPIFNTKETSMPYAFQLLSEDFDLGRDPNELEVVSSHAKLDLASLGINWRDFAIFADGGTAGAGTKAFDEYHEEQSAKEKKAEEISATPEAGAKIASREISTAHNRGYSGDNKADDYLIVLEEIKRKYSNDAEVLEKLKDLATNREHSVRSRFNEIKAITRPLAWNISDVDNLLTAFEQSYIIKDKKGEED